MMPTELDAERLYVFVCGPGQGESIAVRVPPDSWIVIDSCRSSGKVFARHVLNKYGGRRACLVLTHRHRDHYRGFSALAEIPDWQIIACNDRTLVDPDRTEDSEEKLAGELGQIFALIRNRWLNDDNSQWETWRGTSRTIGDAELITLHPDEGRARAMDIPSSADENELSSAMMLKWKSNLFLLGADTPNPHWQDIKEYFAAHFDPSAHVFAKIPHHGSLESLNRCVLSADHDRLWVVTPHASRAKLPSHEPGEGLEFLLGENPEVHLTGLPVAQNTQPASPCRTTLQALREGKIPEPIEFSLPGLVGVDVTPTRGDIKNYFIIAIDAAGNATLVDSGDGSVIVGPPSSLENEEETILGS